VVQQRNLADIPGLDITLRQVTRAYRQQVLAPASAIEPDMRVTLPVPAWAEFAFATNVDAIIGAGQAVTVTALQVPANERAWLDGYQMQLTSGDNRVVRIQVTYPLAFGSSPQVIELIELATSDTDIFWPDPGGVQTINKGLPVGPILLEPLANVEMTTDGTGVASTTFRVQILRRRMRLTRASAP